MTSVPLPAQPTSTGRLRPLNILRDLSRVADLIELCFASSMDSEGRSYVRQMRRASRDASFMRWASNAIESTSMPLSGFVWEQDGRIIGNVSLVPFRFNNKRYYLIANVATHPDHRRKGIARALTEQAMQRARQRGATELWLHVRADNPVAIKMYTDMGFVERARRTTWRIQTQGLISTPPAPSSDRIQNLITVSGRYARFWPQQIAWLNQLHPDYLSWYRSMNWNNLRPGLWNWIYRLFVEIDLKQWAVQRDGHLQAALTWMPTMRNASLWLACGPNSDAESISRLLRKAYQELGHRKNIKLEHPGGLHEEAIQGAGFSNVRTLVWMYTNNAT